MEDRIITLLWAVKVGDPDYAETALTDKKERIEDAKEWGERNGYDRFRIATINMNQQPKFS